MNNFLTCETKDGLMDIYVSSPESESNAPVIIVLQEAFGVNSHIRSICDRLAEKGFLAAAPDLFHREGRRIEVAYSDRKEIYPILEKMTNAGIINDVRDTINFLQDIPKADLGSVSTIGFCVGGFASALCATKLNLKKMVSFYGGGMVSERENIGLTPILGELKNIKCPCLFFFGGKDASIPLQEVKVLEEKLTEGKVKFEVDIFPYSDHGFFCDERKSYNQDDASVAWKKTLAFLKE